tara:strand:- start:105 stop:329 length:225 start_codon:yes stop_codon:yes gene_type:complete
MKMIDTRIEILESRIEGINNAIAKMREDATPATKMTVEMAIEMLALPELEDVEAELASVFVDIAMENASNERNK